MTQVSPRLNFRVHLPTLGDSDLVRRVVQHLNPEATEASVRPLGRFGYTDSRLYLTYCAPGEGGLPFVVKTDKPESVRREARGVTRVRTFFEGARDADVFPLVEAPEAIIYPLVAIDNYRQIVELKDVLYALPVVGRPSSAQLLARTYERTMAAHRVRTGGGTFADEYSAYQRLNHDLHDPIPELFGTRRSILVHGYDLQDPLRVFESVSSERVASGVCAVHGDLHPNNVLFGPSYEPVLIDFAFADPFGHWMKDFVLMEVSVRFLLAPRLLRPDVVIAFDRMLLAENGYLRMDELGATGALLSILTEMHELVMTIRRRARDCCAGFSWEEYLRAMYMVLRGNLRLPSYQHFRALVALCDIADAIEREE